jgi:hypothetical protein
MHAMLLATRPHKTSARTFWRSRSPKWVKRHDDWHAVTAENQATSRVAAPMERRQITRISVGNKTKDLWGTHGNCQGSASGDRETTEKWRGGLVSHQEMGAGGKGWMPVYTLGPPITCWFWLQKGPTLAWSHRAGSVTKHAVWQWTPGNMWLARPNTATQWLKRQPNQCYTLQAISGEALPLLKEVILTLTLGQHLLKIRVFITNITNRFVLSGHTACIWCISGPRAPNAASCIRRSIAVEPWGGAPAFQPGSGQWSGDNLHSANNWWWLNWRGPSE